MEKFRFQLQMRGDYHGRIVDADSFSEQEPWLIFYRAPATGGRVEYCRVRIDHVVCMETVRNPA